jgi:hypothetical protein
MKNYGKIMVLVAVSLMIFSGIAIMENGNVIKNQPGSTINPFNSVSWWSGIKGASLKTEYLGHTGNFIVTSNMIIQLNGSTVYYYNISTGNIINSVTLPVSLSNPYIGFSNGNTYIIFSEGTYGGYFEINSNYIISESIFSSSTYPSALYHDEITSSAITEGPYIIIPKFYTENDQLGIDYSYATQYGCIISQNITILGQLTGFNIIDPITGLNTNITLPSSIPQWVSVFDDNYPTGFTPPYEGAGWNDNLPLCQGFEDINGMLYFITANYEISYNQGATTSLSEFPVYQRYTWVDVYQIYPKSSNNIFTQYTSTFYTALLNIPVDASYPEFWGGGFEGTIAYFHFVDYPQSYNYGLWPGSSPSLPHEQVVSSMHSPSPEWYASNWGPVMVSDRIIYNNNQIYFISAYNLTVPPKYCPLPANFTPSITVLNNGFEVVSHSTLPYSLYGQYPLAVLAKNGELLSDDLMIAYNLVSPDSEVFIFNSTTFSLAYSLTIPEVSNSFTVGNTWYYISSGSTLYIITLPKTFNLNVNVFGLPQTIHPNISIFNSSFNSSFAISVLPGTIPMNISIPSGYIIQNISISGPGLSILNSIMAKYKFASKYVNLSMNLSADPTLNITYMPIAFKVSLDSNLNQGISWLVRWNFEKNVTWQARIYHGTDPSAKKVYANFMSNSTITNYTLIQNSTNSNMSFYLRNGTYKYDAYTTPVFIPISLTNLTVSGNETVSLNFSTNYPYAVISSEVQTIPQDTAWVFQSTSYALFNTTITSTVWVITGPQYYYGTGSQFIAYFNTSGSYHLSLTVTNNYGVYNSTGYNFSVLAFHKASIYFSISKKTGYWSNTSATFIMNVSYSSKLGAMSNLQGIIDGNSYMKIQFVSFVNRSGNYSYEYFATFDPSDFPPANHTIQFEVYTVGGYYNETKFSMYFGSINYNKPFNLIDFLGGPANFIMILLGAIGTVITIAEIKISRTSDLIIESGGKESVLKAKPVKQSLTQKLANRKNAKMQKKKNSRRKGGI